MVAFMIRARRRKACGLTAGVFLSVGTVLASGCSGTLEDVFPDRQPSYKSSRSAPPLEIPPDLTSSAVRDSLPVPGVDATYSQYASDAGSVGAQSGPEVLPEIEDARIERSGGQRWLVVSVAPEDVWPRLREFWIDQGFSLDSEEPDVGIMETNWAEKHEALPAGAITRALNRLSDALYGVAFRDRYRTRVERGSEPGATEIYISHRGAEQEVVGDETPYAQREGLGKRVWQPRPSDPELEAEMLARLMIFLGADEERAETLVAGSDVSEPRARLVIEDGRATALAIDEDFSRAWRRTGLALDRAGFAVEDRDRSRGLFFVRYAGGAEGREEGEGKGWLSSLKFWGNDDGEKQGEDAYVVRVIGDTPAAARVVVLDGDGERDTSPAVSRILTALHEQLE